MELENDNDFEQVYVQDDGVPDLRDYAEPPGPRVDHRASRADITMSDVAPEQPRSVPDEELEAAYVAVDFNEEFAHTAQLLETVRARSEVCLPLVFMNLQERGRSVSSMNSELPEQARLAGDLSAAFSDRPSFALPESDKPAQDATLLDSLLGFDAEEPMQVDAEALDGSRARE